jgi:hypothetical protein
MFSACASGGWVLEVEVEEDGSSGIEGGRQVERSECSQAGTVPDDQHEVREVENATRRSATLPYPSRSLHHDTLRLTSTMLNLAALAMSGANALVVYL